MKKHGDSKKGDKQQNILRLLGVKKKEVSAAPPPVEPPSQTKTSRIPPESFDALSMKRKYPNFVAIQKDALEFPQFRDKLLDAVIDNDELFGKYICNMNMLQALIVMRPNQIDQFIENILTKPNCQGAFVNGMHVLHRTTEVLKSYKDKMVKYSLQDDKLRQQLIRGLANAKYALKHFPEYRKEFLDMLVNNKEMFERCTDCTKEEFFAFCKEQTEYTQRFVEYVFTSDIVYREMISLGSIDYFMEQFPGSANRLVDFILSSDERFYKEFAIFKDIYAFEKKHPEYAGKLINKALSIKSYIQGKVICASDIVDMHAINPARAQKILSMVLADDEWVLKFLRIPSDFEDFFRSDLLKPIGDACIALVYLNPNKFASKITNDKSLKVVIDAAPKDQEHKLRLYYQLYTKAAPLTEVIDKHCNDVETLAELQVYLARNLATMKPPAILQLREHITERLKKSDDSAEIRSALVELQASLVTPAKTDAMATDKLKFMGSKSNTSEAETQKPHSPPKNHDFG